MLQALQLAFRNLWGAGLRTWLNASVLAFSIVIILFFNGLIDGWNNQARIDSTNWEFGNGILYNNKFDPTDPFTYTNGYGILTKDEQLNLTPILVQPITLYPKGRMVAASLKGIPHRQNILSLPTKSLSHNDNHISAIIGKRMANSLDVSIGDEIMIRWYNKNGIQDSTNIKITEGLIAIYQQ